MQSATTTDACVCTVIDCGIGSTTTAAESTVQLMGGSITHA